MNPISPKLARRARRAAMETHGRYELRDWIWALNLEARDDPRELQKVAAILREMKAVSSPPDSSA